ncbi:AbrB family transcriptional regulator [Acidithiobacillus sp. CV18-2]|uniref:AbrB family transcriptional regulator n=2 Tax=Acidithiobacillales TaxID=225057 RepID=A0AAE2YPJ1_9PROT|nr:AbrB family transcriptional regulator [Acidithiobacillus sp. CV18-3]MBU2758558.1 AbrB family transcriptional regulator [Acidithiobacillus sp. BN09-2]MBU2764392.1 AbrB family transcriptional regulator [Acidithiobacillus caldus]MBU2776885.1 AbrB family transcriptional regulator [Acidithiobacillus sp. CV18-2]MBU2787870.1 AbrB family transcriptional regulator [Igneacidithiobacillus copahuensis]MBU2795486.1 AbrB family transcriptional regulator [Acidithiobacillus sp. VAN18-2]MBU2800043.1 AbrB f
MQITKIRKQGGASVVTLPTETLKALALRLGDALQVEVFDHGLLLKPLHGERRRYSVKELLEGLSEMDVQSLSTETTWVRNGAPRGREIG